MAMLPTIESDPASAPHVARRLASSVIHWRAFWAAVQFLTRAPVPIRFLAEPGDSPRLQLATIYFPLVGCVIGLITAAMILLASQVWPTWVAVLVGMAIDALVTGALHEDALADCCDALGGGWTRADVLRILDDSRLGTYGVLGLTLALLLRGGAIAALDARVLIPAVIASATLGRWTMVLTMALLPPVPERPSLTQQAGKQSYFHVLSGMLLSLPGVLPLALTAPLRLAASFAAAMIVTVLAIVYLRRRMGGITGDGAGAVCYLAQISVLLCCCASLAAQQ